MKFCKKYEEYMQEQNQKKELPEVGFKKLKKILKKCRTDDLRSLDHDLHPHQISANCPHHCPDTNIDVQSQMQPLDAVGDEVVGHGCDICGHIFVQILCDGTFFPSLLNEMSAVVGTFNERAQKLLDLHLASGFRKCFIWFKDKLHGNHVALIQECRDLVTYAIFNAIAMRKILKKYDKIHYSKQGQAFKSQAQSMHLEILQSPWLCELMAFHINLRETKPEQRKASALFDGCSLVINEGKASLFCELFDSIKLDIDLTCSVCLDTVFDPVALTCGHIYCYMCACKSASVTIVDGLKAANRKEKCPLCRDAGVFEGAVHLDELNILLSRSCPEYWEERLQAERVERIQQVKEHWEYQCRAFMGV